jgi:hypothetical protein
MTDIERWPDWNPDVKSASLEGDLVVGTRFRWKAGPGTIASTLQELERPWKVAWIGRTLGIDAVDVFELEAQNDHTIVRQSESWNGMIVRALRPVMRKTLEKSMRSGLEALKAEAERRAGGNTRLLP